MKPTVFGMVYLDMLDNYLMPQLQEQNNGSMIFQQDGTLLHFHTEVCAYLDAVFSGMWIGHIPWSLHSPDLTPLDFTLWGFIKDQVYVPPMPGTLPELWQCITEV
jgi:hypothetical protein